MFSSIGYLSSPHSSSQNSIPCGSGAVADTPSRALIKIKIGRAAHPPLPKKKKGSIIVRAERLIPDFQLKSVRNRTCTHLAARVRSVVFLTNRPTPLVFKLVFTPWFDLSYLSCYLPPPIKRWCQKLSLKIEPTK
jgi:hypothetical protein